MRWQGDGNGASSERRRRVAGILLSSLVDNFSGSHSLFRAGRFPHVASISHPASRVLAYQRTWRSDQGGSCLRWLNGVALHWKIRDKITVHLGIPDVATREVHACFTFPACPETRSRAQSLKTCFCTLPLAVLGKLSCTPSSPTNQIQLGAFYIRIVRRELAAWKSCLNILGGSFLLPPTAESPLVIDSFPWSLR